jgi:predicted DCC family thiol-disulfide oxidoreductase YuxK
VGSERKGDQAGRVGDEMSVSASPTLIFDGDCAFCARWAAWARRHLPPGTHVEPWQGGNTRRYGLTVSEVQSAAYWIGGDGRAWRGSRGLAQAMMTMGRGWKALGMVIEAPIIRWMAAAGYTLIARWRHRLAGGEASCGTDRRS